MTLTEVYNNKQCAAKASSHMAVTKQVVIIYDGRASGGPQRSLW